MHDESPPLRPGQKMLVLCFDGTGNRFSATEEDTNIVKLYQMLDRKAQAQYHYYQPGIGTYLQNESSLLPGPISRLIGNVQLAIDQAVGTSFQHHVMGGYQFLMRYFTPGDRIYIFGFSRGAYTARFLAEMLHTIGLLSKGNEETTLFAWKTFSEFQASRRDEGPDDIKRRDFMVKFKETFCRSGVEVHFLGLWDCVNSVGQFEIPFWRTTPQYIANPPAKHIRHAVSIHERRVKFKPALVSGFVHPGSDVKEVWFAGNHADVGGGWGRSIVGQRRLLSDASLAWMVDEIKNLPEGENTRLKFATEKIPYSDSHYSHLRLTDTSQTSQDKKKSLYPHDMLTFGGGVGFLAVILWWILELLPITSRLEYEYGKWVPRYWPPSAGAKRDIPLDADIHSSVHVLYKTGVLKKEDMPELGGDGPTLTLTGSMMQRWGKPKTSRSDVMKKLASALPSPTLHQNGVNGVNGHGNGHGAVNGNGVNGHGAPPSAVSRRTSVVSAAGGWMSSLAGLGFGRKKRRDSVEGSDSGFESEDDHMPVVAKTWDS